VTQVVPLATFYPAEEHHQNYCNRHSTDRYVQEVALPKIEKTKKQVPELLKK
jgi:peptide-methionine (S)-S-oxide reductase